MSDSLNFLSKCCIDPVTQPHHKNKVEKQARHKNRGASRSNTNGHKFYRSHHQGCIRSHNYNHKIGRDRSRIHSYGHCLHLAMAKTMGMIVVAVTLTIMNIPAATYMLILFLLKQFCVHRSYFSHDTRLCSRFQWLCLST